MPTRIYSVLCKRIGTEGYKVKKIRELSAQGDEPYGHLDVAFNPEDNSFVVVWTADAIYARKVRASGRPSAPARILATGSEYLRVVISYAPSVPGASPSDAGGYLIAFDAEKSDYDSALWTMFLDADGKAVTEPVKVSTGFEVTQSRPHDILRAADGSFLIAFIKSGSELKNHCAFIVKLSPAGKKVRESQVGPEWSADIDVEQLSKKLFIATCNDGSKSYSFTNQLFTGNLKHKKSPFEPLAGYDSYLCRLVKLYDYDGVLQLSRIANTNIYVRMLNSKGTYANDPSMLVWEGYLITDMQAVCLPGSNTVFLVYGLARGGNDFELRGFVFDGVQ